MGHKGRCDLPFFSPPPLQRLLKKAGLLHHSDYSLWAPRSRGQSWSEEWPLAEQAGTPCWRSSGKGALDHTETTSSFCHTFPSTPERGKEDWPSVNICDILAAPGTVGPRKELHIFGLVSGLALECAVAHQGTMCFFSSAASSVPKATSPL